MAIDDTSRTAPHGRSPDSSVRIADAETLRALSHPLRLQVLQAASEGEWTVKKLAAALGVRPTRLYRHVAMLESHGLLKVSGTRTVSGILEKRYVVAFGQIEVDWSVFGPGGGPGTGPAALAELVRTAFAATAEDIGRSAAAGRIHHGPEDPPHERLRLSHGQVRLGPGQAAEFTRKLDELLAGLKACPADPAEETRGFGFLATFYPLADPPQSDETAEVGERPADA